jgi:dihydroorotate dehydrogenase
MYSLIRSLLFQLDAESAHELTTAQMMRLQEIPIALSLIARICRPRRDFRQIWGITFATPIGIAAGFDKNALLMPFLAALGFGFLEVGTVTLYAQPGNPKPRVFRDPQNRAFINRLGFNNDGADAVAQRLQRFDGRIPIFVNIGKNRDVPLEDAPAAYAACAKKVVPYAHAIVINVSSPNTPALRELQRPEHLEKVIRAVGRERPLLVKIAPDLALAEIDEICDVCKRLADGMVCTNTTITPEGGLSGKPLFGPSTDILAAVRERVGPDYPLIGVGGIFDAKDARAKFAAGADLIQLYTGFVYEGPSLPSRLARELAR